MGTLKYDIVLSTRYKQAYRRAKKRNLPIEQLDTVVYKLAMGETLEAKYKDHALIGDYKGYRECHIQPNWLLVYKIVEDKCILYLLDTGTHADLFDM